MTDKALYPELEDHLKKLAEGFGRLTLPLHAYIAGGVAVNYHTRIRMSDDVDIQWSHKVVIPKELQIFEVINPDDPDDVLNITMDGSFGDYLGSFHPDWEKDSIMVGQVGDIVIHVISAVDLAVSKLARYAERDREDIAALIQAGLLNSAEFDVRANEALQYYAVGDTSYIVYNIQDTIKLIEAYEGEKERK